jgi:hypothetical protein
MKILNKLTALLMLLSTSHIVSAASLGTGGLSTAFSKGATSVSAVVGAGSAFNDEYIIFGLGASYYVAKGLSLGIDAEYWLSGDPSITKVTPRLTYVFTQPKVIRPYVGAFYRRTFYGDFKGISIDDQNSYGYRAGAYFSASNNVYIGAGFVYETFMDCNSLSDCSTTYPEMTFAVSF